MNNFKKFSIYSDNEETTASGDTNSGHQFSEGGEVPSTIYDQLKDRQEKVYNAFVEHIEDKYFLEELGPGGYWKVKDGMEKEHEIIDDWKDLVSDMEDHIKSLHDQLAVKGEELKRYIAANSILCDSESEVKLANENNRLEIENKKLKAFLEEMIRDSNFPGANYTIPSHWREQAKKLLDYKAK